MGVRCVVAKSFARIHVANLINAGILPLTFENPDDYELLAQGSKLTIDGIFNGMQEGRLYITDDKGNKIPVICNLTQRQIAILSAGGLLNYTKENGQ